MYIRYTLLTTVCVMTSTVTTGEEKKDNHIKTTSSLAIPIARHNQQKRKSLVSTSPIQLENSPFAETTNNLLSYCMTTQFLIHHEDNSPKAPPY